jgi:hypothetical protein
VEDDVHQDNPSNGLLNPYEAEDPDAGNGRQSRAMLRLLATGGAGACAIAATVLAAGSANAGTDDFGGFGSGDLLGSGGLITVPSSTPTFDMSAISPPPSTLTVADLPTITAPSPQVPDSPVSAPPAVVESVPAPLVSSSPDAALSFDLSGPPASGLVPSGGEPSSPAADPVGSPNDAAGNPTPAGDASPAPSSGSSPAPVAATADSTSPATGAGSPATPFAMPEGSVPPSSEGAVQFGEQGVTGSFGQQESDAVKAYDALLPQQGVEDGYRTVGGPVGVTELGIQPVPGLPPVQPDPDPTLERSSSSGSSGDSTSPPPGEGTNPPVATPAPAAENASPQDPGSPGDGALAFAKDGNAPTPGSGDGGTQTGTPAPTAATGGAEAGTAGSPDVAAVPSAEPAPGNTPPPASGSAADLEGLSTTSDLSTAVGLTGSAGGTDPNPTLAAPLDPTIAFADPSGLRGSVTTSGTAADTAGVRTVSGTIAYQPSEDAGVQATGTIKQPGSDNGQPTSAVGAGEVKVTLGDPKQSGVSVTGSADVKDGATTSTTEQLRGDVRIGNVTDPVNADIFASTKSTQTGGTTENGDKVGVQLNLPGGFSVTADRGFNNSATSNGQSVAGVNEDRIAVGYKASFGGAPSSPAPSGDQIWSDVKAPLDAPIGVTDPAFLPGDTGDVPVPDGAGAPADPAMTSTAVGPVAVAEAQPSTPNPSDAAPNEPLMLSSDGAFDWTAGSTRFGSDPATANPSQTTTVADLPTAMSGPTAEDNAGTEPTPAPTSAEEFPTFGVESTGFGTARVPTTQQDSPTVVPAGGTGSEAPTAVPEDLAIAGPAPGSLPAGQVLSPEVSFDLSTSGVSPGGTTPDAGSGSPDQVSGSDPFASTGLLRLPQVEPAADGAAVSQPSPESVALRSADGAPGDASGVSTDVPALWSAVSLPADVSGQGGWGAAPGGADPAVAPFTATGESPVAVDRVMVADLPLTGDARPGSTNSSAASPALTDPSGPAASTLPPGTDGSTPTTLAELLATAPVDGSGARVPGNAPLSFAGGDVTPAALPSADQVAGRTGQTSTTTSPDAPTFGVESTGFGSVKVPTTGMPADWGDRQGGSSSFDAGTAGTGESAVADAPAPLLSPELPISWSGGRASTEGMTTDWGKPEATGNPFDPGEVGQVLSPSSPIVWSDQAVPAGSVLAQTTSPQNAEPDPGGPPENGADTPAPADQGQSTAEQQKEPTQAERLMKAGFYAASGRGVSWVLLKRDVDPTITPAKFAPVAGVDFAKDLVVGGALTPIKGYGDIVNPLLEGARGALINEGVNVAARTGINPALNAAADAYNARNDPGSPAANIRADVVIGANNQAIQPTIPLLDPGRLTTSPDVAANTPDPRRLTVSIPPDGSSSPQFDSAGKITPSRAPTDLFSSTPSEPSTGRVEIVPASKNSTAPLPSGFTDGVYPQGEVTAAKLTDAPSAVRRGAYLSTDLTGVGINMAVPATTAVANGILEGFKQENNPWVSIPANGVAVGIGVGGPISIAQRNLVKPAFVGPGLQAMAADLFVRGVKGLLPQDQQQALNTLVDDACTDGNPAVSAAKQFVCSAGRNPNETPPTNPPASTGGAVVTEAFPPSTGNPPVSLGNLASPVLQPGTPLTTGDTSWSSVAVKNPQAVPPAPAASQPPGDITWSSQRATEAYTPPAQETEAPVTLGWSTQKATVPTGWQPGSATNWASAPAPSTSTVKKPAAVPSTVQDAGAQPATTNPVQQFTDFVGGVGDAIDKNVVRPAGDALNSAGDAINKNVVTPLSDAYQRADADARERMSRAIKTSAPLDGVFGIGATRYKVETMDGAVGEYDADGRLLNSQKGDPPAKVNNPGLYTGGTPMMPAAPGSMPANVPMRLPIVP